MEESERVWADDMPDAYDGWLASPVFRPFAVDLAERASRQSARSVLELAAGTGVLTRELMKFAGAEVVATDLNPPMVRRGAANVPQARWLPADAMHLPFGNGLFDLVVCQFGVMFLPDKPTGFAEARRVLAPGGAFLFNTWGPIAEHELESAVTAALRRLFPADPPTFLATTPHGYADPERVVADVRAGGFTEVDLATVVLEGRAESAADVASGYCLGTPLRAAIQQRGDLPSVRAALTAALAAEFGSGPLTWRMSAHAVTASAV
ncbi:MAG TPA: class I SAM-dependent methyltransferase [Mycobacteriales bacterium]|nr:class I SAM-dependent methyltransferase [Mycobacteriales bacterium]